MPTSTITSMLAADDAAGAMELERVDSASRSSGSAQDMAPRTPDSEVPQVAQGPEKKPPREEEDESKVGELRHLEPPVRVEPEVFPPGLTGLGRRDPWGVRGVDADCGILPSVSLYPKFNTNNSSGQLVPVSRCLAGWWAVP